MDALIMAAGRGSRLGPETADRPKSLVDVGGTTPLELQLDVLASRGLRRAVVVTGYRREAVEETVRRSAGGRFDVTTVWNPFWPLTNVLGSAWMARREIGTDLVYLHADTVFDPTILDDLLAHPAQAVLPIDVRACEPEQMKARIADGRVAWLSKDLAPDETAGEFIGIAYFRRPAVDHLVDGMDAVIESGAFGAYFEEAINWAIRERHLEVEYVPTRERHWTEIDFVEDLELARSFIQDLRP